MATQTGRKTIDLREHIATLPSAFTLNQLLHMLGYLNTRTPAEQSAYLEKAILIRPWLSLAFPSTEVTDLVQEEGAATVVTTTLFGLYSTLGSLPTLYTEELLEEARNDESVSRDFLDIINAHINRLRFRADRHNSLASRTIEDEDPFAAFIQFCLMGQSMQAGKLPKAYLTEIFARRTRGAAQLERYLTYALHREDVRDVRVEQCVERVVPIPLDQRAQLGCASVTLGEDAMIGLCVHDSTGKFRIHLDRLSSASLRHFLPGAPGYNDLTQHLTRFLDTPLDYELTLHPEGEAPKPRLGMNCALGFSLGTPTTWPAVRVFWKHERGKRAWLSRHGGDTVLLP